jgi:Family of unknown function (DUF5681)
MSKRRSRDSRKDADRVSSTIARRAGDPAYQVGYGRPPLHTQFQPGVSGNPKGRPRISGDRNFKEEIQQEYLRKIAVHDGVKTRRVTVIVALFRKLLHDALKGDLRAALASYKLAEALGIFDIKTKKLQVDLSMLTDDERQICDQALGILRKARVLV